MNLKERVAHQTLEELQNRLWLIHSLIPGVDPVTDKVLVSQLKSASARIAEVLVDDDGEGDNERANYVVDVLNALFVGPCDPPAEWWATPLGGVCARSLGTEDATSFTHSVAAGFLGVTRSTVATLVKRGKLDRHPDGGIVPASVWSYRDTRRPPAPPAT